MDESRIKCVIQLYWQGTERNTSQSHFQCLTTWWHERALMFYCIPLCVCVCVYANVHLRMKDFVWMSPNSSMWLHMLAHSIYRWLWPRTWQLCIFHRVENPALQCLYIAASSSCDSGSGSDQRRGIKATSPAPFLSGLSLLSKTLSHYFTSVIHFCVFLLSCSRLWNSSRNCGWTI